MQHFIEQIRPSADLRRNYHEMAKICKEGTPIAVTVNGKADTVLLSHQDYLELQARLALYEHLAQSEEDIRMGRETTMETVFARMEKDLKEAAREL